jgi:hypothetical protein
VIPQVDEVQVPAAGSRCPRELGNNDCQSVNVFQDRIREHEVGRLTARFKIFGQRGVNHREILRIRHRPPVLDGKKRRRRRSNCEVDSVDRLGERIEQDHMTGASPEQPDSYSESAAVSEDQHALAVYDISGSGETVNEASDRLIRAGGLETRFDKDAAAQKGANDAIREVPTRESQSEVVQRSPDNPTAIVSDVE